MKTVIAISLVLASGAVAYELYSIWKKRQSGPAPVAAGTGTLKMGAIA